MTNVLRKNVVYTVDDNAVEGFREKGFSVLDNSGKVVNSAHPVTLAEYKVQYAKLQKDNTKLKADLKKAQDELAALKADTSSK